MNSSSEDLSTDEEEVKLSFIRRAKLVENELLPPTSKDKYIKCWESFEEWQKKQNTTSCDETRLLVYFSELSEAYSPATLWSKWSMLKAIMRIKKSINLDQYTKLKAFVKQKSRNYRSKQAATFSYDNLTKFCNDAPDEIHLGMKGIAIIGIFCAMRCAEFCTLTSKDVADTNPYDTREVPNRFLIKIIDAKNKKPREYVIGDPFYDYIKRYIDLRPPNAGSTNFFLKYQAGKVCRQNIGRNSFGSSPKKVSEWLCLENPDKFTGHSWRRSAATILAEKGGTVIDVKQLGNWSSDALAHRYIQRSKGTQLRIFDMMSKSTDVLPENNTNQPQELSQTLNPTMPRLENSKKRYQSFQAPSTSYSKSESVKRLHQSFQASSTSHSESESAKKLRQSSPSASTTHSKSEFMNYFNPDDETWINEAADNSIFIGIPDDSELDENGNHSQPTTTNVTEPTGATPPSTRNQNDRRPLKNLETNHRIVQQALRENTADYNPATKLDHCTIHNVVINNYFNNRENESPK